MRMLDLFCGRFGWSAAFSARGWQCVGIDLAVPAAVPAGCEFVRANVLDLDAAYVREFDFACASSPCEEFSVHGMKHFHPHPKYPEGGIRLFNHTRAILEESGIRYVMENVRPAQQFVGVAAHHCGPFYLWGNAVPPLMPQGIRKGIDVGSSKAVKAMGSREEKREYRAQFSFNQEWSGSAARQAKTAKAATIPAELSRCVAEYAERLRAQ